MSGETFVLQGHDFFGHVLGDASAAGPQLAVSSPPVNPKTLPLSRTQTRLWSIRHQQPDPLFANSCVGLRFSGRLSLPVLQESLDELVSRQEALRTTFVTTDEQTVQVVLAPLPVALPVVDLSEFPKTDQAAETRRRIEAEVQQPFDVSEAPPMRAKLLRLGETEHVLLITTHRIIADKWSQRVLIQEFMLLYEAFSKELPSPLPTLRVSYGDFVTWEHHLLEDDEVKKQLGYWKQQLDQGLPGLSLAADRPYPAVPSFQGACQSLDVPNALRMSLGVLSQREGVTPSLILLTVFNVLLFRYTGEESVMVGCELPNRQVKGSECLIGPFTKTLPLRTDLSGNPSFRRLLGRVRAAV